MTPWKIKEFIFEEFKQSFLKIKIDSSQGISLNYSTTRIIFYILLNHKNNQILVSSCWSINIKCITYHALENTPQSSKPFGNDSQTIKPENRTQFRVGILGIKVKCQVVGFYLKLLSFKENVCIQFKEKPCLFIIYI